MLVDLSQILVDKGSLRKNIFLKHPAAVVGEITPGQTASSMQPIAAAVEKRSLGLSIPCFTTINRPNNTLG